MKGKGTGVASPSPNWDRLSLLLQRSSPPPGAVTVDEVAARFGINRTTANNRLRWEVSKGTMKTAKFNGANGRVTAYFWPAEGGSNDD